MPEDRIKLLEKIAHYAWHLLEESCDQIDGDITVSKFDYDRLNEALYELTGEGGDIHDFIGQSDG